MLLLLFDAAVDAVGVVVDAHVRHLLLMVTMMIRNGEPE
jgi:hypothetical protein